MNAVADCQLCGSSVNIQGQVAVCPTCGAEYDVIRHGRRDFSTSPGRSLEAQKKPSSIGCSLWDEGRTRRLEATTQWVGTKIQVNADLWDRSVNMTPLLGKSVRIWHRLDTGSWEKIFDGYSNAPDLGGEWFRVIYTLRKSGTHTFYAEFQGDDEYAGCDAPIHALQVSGQDYGISPEVSVEAQPALTVIVKDMILRKPIEGAKVIVDAVEAATDASGMAVFDALAPGAYTVTVSARDYKSVTRPVELTAAGMVVEVYLLHVAAIALGIVSVGAVGVVVAHKALKKK